MLSHTAGGPCRNWNRAQHLGLMMRMKYHMALVWHRVMATFKPTLAPPPHQNNQQPQPAPGNAQRKGPIFSQPSTPGDSACLAYNRGTCTNNSPHPQDLYVCNYCLMHQCSTPLLPHRAILPKEGSWDKTNGGGGGSRTDHPLGYICVRI